MQTRAATAHERYGKRDAKAAAAARRQRPWQRLERGLAWPCPSVPDLSPSPSPISSAGSCCGGDLGLPPSRRLLSRSRDKTVCVRRALYGVELHEVEHRSESSSDPSVDQSLRLQFRGPREPHRMKRAQQGKCEWRSRGDRMRLESSIRPSRADCWLAWDAERASHDVEEERLVCSIRLVCVNDPL